MSVTFLYFLYFFNHSWSDTWICPSGSIKSILKIIFKKRKITCVQYLCGHRGAPWQMDCSMLKPVRHTEWEPHSRSAVVIGSPSLDSLPSCRFSELPGPPTNVAISNIGPRSVTLQFKPGYDGKTSISRWQVEAQVSRILAQVEVPISSTKNNKSNINKSNINI